MSIMPAMTIFFKKKCKKMVQKCVSNSRGVLIVHSSLFVVRERHSMNYEQKTMNTVFRVNLAETNQVKNTDFLIDLTRIENQFTILHSRFPNAQTPYCTKLLAY